jgi:hypothetical protein
MSAYAEYQCDRCGGAKRLFFVRGPVQLAISAALVALAIIVRNTLPDGLLQSLLVSGGIGLAILTAASLLRIRCLNCEPEWKEKMWR